MHGCERFGFQRHHFNKCPALNKVCRKCGLVGYFERCCTTSPKQVNEVDVGLVVSMMSEADTGSLKHCQCRVGDSDIRLSLIWERKCR